MHEVAAQGSRPYLTLKLSQRLYSKPPDALDAVERRRVERVAARQFTIEQRILETKEAAQVMLPASSVEQAMSEIRQRYANEDEFLADLEKTGLDLDGLQAAVESDLRFEAVLDRIGNAAETVSTTDIEIFYLIHRDRFRRPENRTLRHILVTINDDVQGSGRRAARSKIDAIRKRLLKVPERFAEQALKHSECPTATNGGLLGTVVRGQLYPELERAGFALPLGELSRVVESTLGFHLIHCVAIEEESELPLSAVREKIAEHLGESRRRAAQKRWIASLLAEPEEA